MTLKEILSEIRERKVESEIVLEGIEPKFRPGVEGTIRKAKDEIARLTKLYKEEAVKNTVLIGVSGPFSKQFADIASKKFKTVSVDFKELSSLYVAHLKERNAQANYSQHEHYLLLTELNTTKAKYGIHFLPPPTFNFNDGAYGQPLEKAIDKVITSNYNNTLYSIVTKQDIGEHALQAEFAGKLLPVVLYNYSGVDTQHLAEPSTTVEAVEEVDEDFVKTVLSQVKKSLKNTKSPKGENNEGEENV